MVSRIAVFGSSSSLGIAVVHFLSKKYPGVQIVAGLAFLLLLLLRVC